MHRLAGKTAIITGATSGIGLETSRMFAREEAQLVLSGRRETQLDDLVSNIRDSGGNAVALAGDVRDEAYVKELALLANREFGGLDVAFNNAGILGHGGDFIDTETREWNDTIETNLTSAYLCARHQIPQLLESGAGSLIFTSSFIGNNIGLPGMAAYAASKAGVVGLARVLAAEYGPSNLRVNVLVPGGTDTPMGRSFIDSPETQSFVNGIHALKRMGRPEEIANAALFLASDDSSFVTGSALYTDGGVSICKT